MDQSSEIKKLLRSYNLKPKDYLGQNFLIDQATLESAAEAAGLTKEDTVLEVGPGLGSLTKVLAKSAKEVVAVEKDKRIIFAFKRETKSYKNVEIINEDILRYDIAQQIPGPFKVVANIPYYLTSKLIANLLALKRKPEVIVVLVQKEVAERIVAAPGHLSVLGISVQFFADAEIIVHVPKHYFWPVPEVDSALVRIRPKKDLKNVDEKLFFRLVKVAFAGKRKQVHNTLLHGLGLTRPQIDELLSKSEIDPTARPQELPLEAWFRLYDNFLKQK